MPEPFTAPLPAGLCPLCGGDNRCGLVAGQSTCWCFEARIPTAVLDRVPADARDQSCICPSCAAMTIVPDAKPPAS